MTARQFAGIRNWEVNYLPDATQPLPVVFYMFSGPDFLYAHQFFPNASTYILAGTEPIGPLPDVLRFAGPALDPVLQNLQKSLNSVLSFSFFITKDMKTDLQREELKGTLPIFYVFLARAGKTITDISFITLDKSGQPHPPRLTRQSKASLPACASPSLARPMRRRRRSITSRPISPTKASAQQPGFLKFCEAQGTGASLLKSASYLMFENGFSPVRDFLLNHSKAIVQDDSGIPIAAFDPAKWLLRFFGSYAGPIDIFKQYYQPQLQASTSRATRRRSGSGSAIAGVGGNRPSSSRRAREPKSRPCKPTRRPNRRRLRSQPRNHNSLAALRTSAPKSSSHSPRSCSFISRMSG